ncbi:MAG: GNAT family N-acetyltransferase [Muribaculaceae bacterium]|nr:GNAT family N-acetyltransferase [Muribaculaceae bacterium]
MTLRKIRHATAADVGRIMAVLDAAKKVMRDSGNTRQWIDGYPTEQTIIRDLEQGGAMVVEDDGVVVAYFAFLPSPEPTYAAIYEGSWLDDSMPYHVVHRMGAVPSVQGIFASAMDYCFSIATNIRVDTHRDNKIMQHLFAKHGFTYCGIIYLANGDERLAFQKIV